MRTVVGAAIEEDEVILNLTTEVEWMDGDKAIPELTVFEMEVELGLKSR